MCTFYDNPKIEFLSNITWLLKWIILNSKEMEIRFQHMSLSYSSNSHLNLYFVILNGLLFINYIAFLIFLNSPAIFQYTVFQVIL